MNFFQNKNPKNVQYLPTSTIIKLETKIISLLDTLKTEKILRNIAENIENDDDSLDKSYLIQKNLTQNDQNSDISFSEEFFKNCDNNNKNEKTLIKKKNDMTHKGFSKSESNNKNFFEKNPPKCDYGFYYNFFI